MESVIAGYPTIRHNKCDLLIDAEALSSGRCVECEKYRKTLHTMATRKKFDSHSTSTNPNSHTNYRYLTRSQLTTRLHNMHDEHRKSALQLERLKKKVQEVCKSGVSLDEEMHEYLKASLEDNCNKVTACTGSFQKIFWDQQQQAASVKNAKSMKWHPIMIKWCLYLRHLSGTSYEL